MVTSTYRVDPELKQQAADLCKRMGMNLNTAINMFLSQMVHDQGLPFTPTTASAKPKVGDVAPNGVAFLGEDQDGYPIVTIPDNLVHHPKHDPDGTPVLPQAWKD